MANWNVIRVEQGSIPTDCGDMLFAKVYVSDQLTLGAQFSNIDLPSSVFSGITVSFFGSSSVITPVKAKRVKTEISDRVYVRFYDENGILKATEGATITYTQGNYASILWALLIDPNGNAVPMPNYIFKSSSSILKLTDNSLTQLGTMRVNRSWYISGTYTVTADDLAKGHAILLSGTPDDPYGYNENQTPSGGYGDFDYTSEDETPPSLPSISAANAGFVTLWNPTISEVGDLADYLWGPTFSVASWQKLWNDPMECLLSLGIVPVALTTGTRSNIYFGNADTGIESAPITTQFVSVDLGSMHIEGRSKSYMDYAPYAKASIYLPYCGTYALDVDEIMDADLALEYHIDIYTGACVAYLTINNRTNSDESVVHNVMYQFTGNCLASIPVTSGDHSQLLQSLLFMGASIAATVATAGAASAGGAIEGLAAEGDVVASSGVLGAATAGSAINTVMSMKPNVMHSGNLSSTAGLLGGQKPFVTFTWSNLCRPDDEYQLVGMPLQKSGTLSDFEGFTIVSACHMDNILCTDAERSMIEQALGRGVII